jgi:beta-galactosidase
VTATAPGLAPARTTIYASRAHRATEPHQGPARAYVGDGNAGGPPAPPAGPTADASYSGKPDTLPAAMIDGNQATVWSNYYLKQATALLPAFSLAHAREWVSVAWPAAQSVDSVRAAFTIDATRALPADIAVRYWDGTRWVAVSNPHVALATASGEPTVITFDPVSTTRLRLDLTSAHPKASNGFVAISGLEVPGVALH